MKEHEQDRQKFYRMSRSISQFLGTPACSESAGEVARYLTRAYVQDRKVQLGFKAWRDSPRFRSCDEIQRTRAWLATRPLSTACYWISSLYSVLVPVERRLALAMYFTPPQLGNHVVRLVHRLLPDFTSARIIDPACGGAAFLVPTVALLRRELRRKGFNARESMRHVETHVIGWERDPVLAYISRTFLGLVMEAEAGVAGCALDPNIDVADSLSRVERDNKQGFDVVLCNPPYRKISAKELPTFRARYGDLIAGQPNLYTIFSAAAMKLARPGGIVTLLTPTSFISGDTFAPLRKFLLSRSRMLMLEMIHERKRVFHDVEQDAALALYERRLTAPPEQRPKISSWNLQGARQRLGSLVLPGAGAAWRVPRTKDHQDMLRVVEQSPWRLEHYGYRATVGAYVWNRDERRCLRAYPRSKLRAKTFPIIWASYVSSLGHFRFKPSSSKEARQKYVVLRGKRDLKFLRRRSCVLLQRTSSRAQAHRLVAAVLPRKFLKQFGGFLAENHVIVLEPTCARPAVSLTLLCRVLRSQILQDASAMASGTSALTVAGLSNLPLPDPDVVKNRRKGDRTFEDVVRRGYLGASVSSTSPPRVRHAAIVTAQTTR